MKRILTTTACIITATVVCAHIANDELSSNKSESKPIVQVAAAEASITPAGDLSPSIYGVCGAAAMAMLIATRRQRTQA
ncbi:hypothetical protein [Pelagicoccus mobilis]|uniref:VPEID-CTERM sorting domain-containing protein n=1 Tax=Pelagicoccus mobilis TaxID=415221 RepID=A0A934VUC0_9BACT|nr:hypothetical protein [Pelagicoccus mobilis]MBK1880384.1 hypothetical protein [Pelagicoccus mobilis]